MDRIGESDRLWLEREPSLQEVCDEFNKFNMDEYNEVVFCGFGEPTERFDDLIKVAAFVKEKYGKKIRINTNGVGSLINPHKDEYLSLVRSKFGEQSFDAMLDFARECTKYIPNVVLTTVDTTISHEEEEECRRICESIGATYRIRPWEE